MPLPTAVILALALLIQNAEQQTVMIHVTTEGRPVARARVSAGEQTGQTDGGGLVALSVPKLPTDVTVDAEGFLPVTVRVATPPANGAVEIALEALPEFEEEVV